MRVMSAAEFCLLMAETIEQARCLPEYVTWAKWNSPSDEVEYLGHNPCKGLCDVLRAATRAGFISRDTHERLVRIMYSVVRHRYTRDDWYFWRPGSWRPRARLLRRLADIMLRADREARWTRQR